MSIEDRVIASTPFAVVDVETPGLSARHDRVVEIAISVVKPRSEPELVLDTLVNPGRPMAGTEIHGITDEDVADAPRFEEVAEIVVAALANRVVAAHNARFDLMMLSAELERCQVPPEVPYLCTMWLPRIADPGVPRLSLQSACTRQGIEAEEVHTAGPDALAAARLLVRYLRVLRKHGIRTFGDLRAKNDGKYQFPDSFEWRPMIPPPAFHTAKGLKARGARASTRQRVGMALYLDAVLDAIADLDLSDAEVRDIEAVRSEAGLSDDELRAVHGRVFFGMLSRFVEDARVDDAEANRLHRLHGLLHELGWAPGDP